MCSSDECGFDGNVLIANESDMNRGNFISRKKNELLLGLHFIYSVSLAQSNAI